jgi:LPXTG-motif cell wall-anchored protein
MLIELYTFIHYILPKGSVRDETSFFIILSILIILIGIAIVFRRRRQKDMNKSEGK